VKGVNIMDEIQDELGHVERHAERMERGVLIFTRAIHILKDMGGLSDDDVKAAIEAAKKEINEEFPTDSE
jgi:hypothetical protein